MVAVNRTTKMLSFINHRIRATIVDGRQIVGRFVAFDRHMNLVLADSEEFRKLPKKKKTNTTTKKKTMKMRRRRREESPWIRVTERRRSRLGRGGRAADSREENFSQKQGADAGGIPGGGVARPAGRGAPMMMPGMMPPPGLGQQQPSSGPPGMMMPPPGFRPGMGPQ
jgi:small nuclear ribonucleoprotein B and B'